ncbi:MDR family oxidoreductase [Ponticaulis sp.]|uniref:acrylyl-CoA reductase (NADPH) n=1 Tax=Ponticaulis sp. TaxID=2020902 RepID=UPI000B6A319D|nr:MDR family oxidoreductase [Ponticaulis sp.]MAI89649.1 oxidoreductase [Ponticaulis sp.]OUY00669.1 MAG: oxidoreductase [Hyphomonadaceae bacterium TMED5]|tara:strand:+ start:140973 stop:141956 length:984 start_codon:yes stop_codon:yes gene_type:complete
MSIHALVTDKTDAGYVTEMNEVAEADLGEGDVTVSVEWSTVNYKDGLALAGKRIMASTPMIGGIDLAGTVESSDSINFEPGDKVLVNGYGLSQTHNGGYATKARIPAEWLIKIPETFSARDTMAIGTAGYTAMLCVLALEHGGLTPASGDILVTGANGGVGSIAISILSGLGYRVIASTGRAEEEAYLKSLGASEIIDRNTLSEPGKPIGSEKWVGAVDSVGSHTLANVLAQTKYRGVVAACGLAQGLDLPASVAPFILRNVTLSGIDSVNAPRDVRIEAWNRLASDLDPAKLEATISEIALADVPETAKAILEGKVRGRTLVKVAG